MQFRMSQSKGVQMKRKVGIAVLAMLLLAAVCTTAVVAKPPEKAPVSHFEVTIENPDHTMGSGKMVVNEKANKYVFNAERLTPGETYCLSINGELIATGTADPYGVLHLKGSCTVTVETVRVTIKPTKQSTLFLEGVDCGWVPGDDVVAFISLEGRLIGPDWEPIPGATLDLYLSDRVTRLEDGAGGTWTTTTDADGSWSFGGNRDLFVSHYGWSDVVSASEITKYVTVHFAGDGQYSEAWAIPIF